MRESISYIGGVESEYNNKKLWSNTLAGFLENGTDIFAAFIGNPDSLYTISCKFEFKTLNYPKREYAFNIVYATKVKLFRNFYGSI